MDPRNLCPECGGRTNDSTTTFFADLGSGVIIIRHVPAKVCDQCGADWIDDRTAEILEKIAEDVRDKGSVIEMKEFSKIAS